MACDLKIGIGLITPHPLVGFGGGGKIILPGVSSIDTIEMNHNLASGGPALTRVGKFEENACLLDVEEAAKMAGLDFKIDVLVNAQRETIALFAGEPILAHHEGVKLAKEVYATDLADRPDIVVVNTYAKGNEATLSQGLGSGLLKEEGGDLVVIANTPEGQITHYLLRSFGKGMGGRLWRERTELPPRVKRLIVFAPFGDRAGGDWIGPAESIIWTKTWDGVLEKLMEVHGDRARVMVVPDATVQYFPTATAMGESLL
jgi:nickel-dependent lactate racemase